MCERGQEDATRRGRGIDRERRRRRRSGRSRDDGGVEARLAEIGVSGLGREHAVEAIARIELPGGVLLVQRGASGGERIVDQEAALDVSRRRADRTLSPVGAQIPGRLG